MTDGSLGPDHRWMVTVLQYLAPAQAGDLVTRALPQATHIEGCCGCTLNRTIRAIGVIRPPEAIPALVDVVCGAESPIHKHLGAVCIKKIARAPGSLPVALLPDQRVRLRTELEQLVKGAAMMEPVKPPKPWNVVPGSLKWFAAQDRAIKAITRLLER